MWRNNIFVDASNIKSSSINRTITDASGTNRSNTANYTNTANTANQANTTNTTNTADTTNTTNTTDTTTTAEVDAKKIYLRRVAIDV